MANLREIKNEVKIIEGDILDRNFQDILLKNDVEYVFHLAAEPYIPHCYDRPRKFFDVNATGTLNVLLACKAARVKRVMHFSTSEVYGNSAYLPIDEEHPTNPVSTYAVSKLAADRLCYTLYHEHGIPVIILRLFNCYGPRETQPYVIPEIISQLSKGSKVRLGNIKARRDFTYVDDAVKGAIALMKVREAEGEVVNLGSGIDHSVEELTNIVAELMGYDSVEIIVESERLRPLDIERLRCDCSKVKKYIDWSPQVDIREGLELTISWFKENNCKWIWETKISPAEKVWKRS
jgi:nucleoside-diphosphate-sugar epimerase